MSEGRNPFGKLGKRNKVILASVLGSVLFLSTLTPVLNIPLLPSSLLPAVIAAPPDDNPGKKLGHEKAKFDIMETTIADIHKAIKTNQITCTELVQAYIDRAAAYNGVCTQLVTEDGAPIPPTTGYVRAGSPIVFPTETVPASSILPDLDQYVGLPLDLGRMETTASDPSVKQQFGWIVGIPEVGQLNALETLNIRGERSVTCKGAFDAHPSSGPLPAGAPPGCEAFRQQPDALERAAELDAQFGNKPDLKELPMYCIPWSIKDPWDTKDMRSTASADVNYAMDAAPRDSTMVAELRAKGAIIYAKANSLEYHAGSGNPGGPAVEKFSSVGNPNRSTWSGLACNPYDTARTPAGSSSGSAPSVAANLVVCSIGESTGGSARYPAAFSGLANLETTRNIESFGGVSPASQWRDRPGIMCRTVEDVALALDALKNPLLGYFDPRDKYTAIPNGLISDEPYANFVVDEEDIDNKPLAGMRVGIVREFMVKEVPDQVAISDQIDKEIKTILRDKLGAELVESVDPLYPDDPSIPNMKYTFKDAFAEILPLHMPEYFSKKKPDGTLEFAVQGHDVTTREYMAKVAKGLAPLSDDLNLLRFRFLPQDLSFSLALAEYLLERGDARVKDWASLNANSKWWGDSRRVAHENWESKVDIRSDGITEGLKSRYVLNLVVEKVMYENDIDVLVNPLLTVPQGKIGFPGGAFDPIRLFGAFSMPDIGGFPSINLPAGFNQIVYEPEFQLSEDKKSYITVTGTVQSLLPHPMPISIFFWGGPGDEATLFKVASAYEAATKHRTPPPDFGPLPGEP